jgi:hypothetical protein
MTRPLAGLGPTGTGYVIAKVIKSIGMQSTLHNVSLRKNPLQIRPWSKMGNPNS